MKYVIIGAGGTGGTLGFYMAKAGMDVTLIARGQHLEAIQKRGLTRERLSDGDEATVPVKACAEKEYQETPDVIFVCVKGYSLWETIPLIARIAGKDTTVIPILNIYGTGGKMQEKLPGVNVTDGCIYVSANIKAPGRILQHGDILRIVFGARCAEEETPAMREIARELNAAGIQTVLSENIRRDAMVKFSYVSPMGTAGMYFDGKAADFQKEGAPREMFCALIREIVALSHAMGIEFEEDLVERNLKILGDLTPEATTSMQRDVKARHPSEIDGLVYEVVRLGKKYGVPTPEYEKAARLFAEKAEAEMIAIRSAEMKDLAEIQSIYACARKFMAKTGNPTQWGMGYPAASLLREDIELGRLYVVEKNERLHGVFMFAVGVDPNYLQIGDGSWISDAEYGVIHRIAGDGEIHGLLRLAVEFCEQKIHHLRIDTHEDNKIMQHTILKNGFTRCGIVHMADGIPRIAYERL